MFKFDKFSSRPAQAGGAASRLLLVLAIIVFVAVIIVYLVMRMATKPPAPAPVPSTANTIPQPVYEQTLGDVRFVFENARDLGNTLKASDVTNPQYSYSKKDFSITERFIEVKMGAQNMGKENIDAQSWDIQNIVDSDGREFEPETYDVAPWLPDKNLCSTLLKPAFDPSPCVKIYEVSKKSTGLKIRVITGVNNSPNNFNSGKFNSALIDLIVTQ